MARVIYLMRQLYEMPHKLRKEPLTTLAHVIYQLLIVIN